MMAKRDGARARRCRRTETRKTKGPDPIVIEPVVEIALAVSAEDTLMIVRDHRMSLFPLGWTTHTIGLEN